MSKKPKNYLPVSQEELDRIAEYRKKQEGSAVKIDPEQLFIAEFGKHYGWAGVMAILNNEIDGSTATWLMQGARKVEAGQLFNDAKATMLGTVSANSKNPVVTFNKVTKNIREESKADI